MPQGDGTGPQGKGPGVGRGPGICRRDPERRSGGNGRGRRRNQTAEDRPVRGRQGSRRQAENENR